MAPEPRRVAVIMELEWPLNRHVALFAGIERYARQHGWVSSIDEVIYDKLPQRRTKSLPYDGIIGRVTKPLAERAIRLGLPVVNVWFSSPARDMLPGVFADFTAAGRLRAEHLLARGFRNFAAITSRGNQGHEVDAKEFRRVVRAAVYPCATGKVALDALDRRKWRATEQAITQWMDQWQPPIGLFTGDDMVGRLVAQACRERRWRVPQDVAIIAGENEEIICEHSRPTLSSVELGYERVGMEAAQLLGRLMDESEKGMQKKRTTPAHILGPPPGLIVRESTDFFAVNDELVAAALAFISANSHRRIGPDAVAKAVATHKRTLQNRFRKCLDRPIATEIRRVRIERAKRELTQDKRRVSDIARDVGFGNTIRMDEVFRRELGVTPSAYRKKQQMEDRT